MLYCMYVVLHVCGIDNHVRSPGANLALLSFSHASM